MCRDSDYMKDLLKIPDSLTYETIQGQIVGKANNYKPYPISKEVSALSRMQLYASMRNHFASNAASTRISRLTSLSC